MRVDFARLNHILIPQRKEDRDRFRQSRAGKLLAPVFGLFWGSLTDEGRTLSVVTLLVGAFSIDVQRTTAFVLFSVLLGLMLGSLLAARALRIDDIVVTVDAPRRVTVGEPVTFDVTCTHTGERGGPHHVLRVRGPFLPWDGAWIGEAPPEVAVDPRGKARVSMKARFVARGVHHLDSFTAAATTPLGLTCGPRRSTDAVKVHVVPRIADVQKLPLAIAARHQPGGVALASKSGEAADLLGLRAYRPGDPLRDLHAKSWARTGIPVVREYQQEYFTRVGVVLDTDTRDRDLLEVAIELAAGVIANLARGDALVDVLVVGDRVHELTLGRSLGHLDQALELLASVERGPALGGADIGKRLEPYLSRLSSVIVIALKTGHDVPTPGVTSTTIVVDAKTARAVRAREPLAW